MKSVSILQFGATPNVEGLQTEYIQAALDSVFLQGGGRVEIPAGEWHTGSIRVRSNTTLLLKSGAKLLGVRDPELYTNFTKDTLEPIPTEVMTNETYQPSVVGQKRDYSFLLAGGRWSNAIIRIAFAENVSIIGEEGSVIDGQDCYDALGEEKYRGPHGISVHYSKNLIFSGYTVQNTGNWAHSIWYSENVRAQKVVALGGHDGIHLTRCHNIEIYDCEFYTGDDCVAGFGNIDTVVKNCVMNTACSGMRYGGTNVLVENCNLYGPAKYFFRGSLTLEEKISGAKANVPHRTNMLSVFTYYADFSVEIPEQPDNIVIRNCTVKNVDRFLHYNFSGNELWQANRPLRSVTFEGIKAEGISMPLTAYGDKDVPLILSLIDCQIAFAESDQAISLLHAAHFERITLKDVHVEASVPAPLVVSWSNDHNLVMENVTGTFEKTIDYTSKPFVCQAI